MHAILLCFILVWWCYHFKFIHVTNLPIFFKVASWALGHWLYCPTTREVTLKDIGKIHWYQTMTKPNKAQTIFITFGIYSIKYKIIFVVWYHWHFCFPTFAISCGDKASQQLVIFYESLINTATCCWVGMCLWSLTPDTSHHGQQSGRSPKVVAPFLLLTLLAI